MSRGRVSSSTIAFCASLIVHAGVVLALSAYYVRDEGRPYLAGFVRNELPWPVSVVQPAPPLPSMEPDDTALGDRTGTGNAINPADGDRPHEAPRAEQSQLFLSRDPAGFGKVGDEPSMSVLPEGGAVGRQQPEARPESATSIAFGVPSTSDDVRPPVKEVAHASAPERPPSVDPPDPANDAQAAPDAGVADADPHGRFLTLHAPAVPAVSVAVAKTQADDREAPSAPRDATAAESPARQSSAQQPVAQQSSANQPGAPQPSADPAPMAESETDPFSATGSVRFLPGKVDVQFGRKHRLLRPRFTLAGMTAALQLPSPVIVGLRLHLDAAGNVTRVDIAKSSGSADIDQPVKVAAYQWWLEPTRDKTGTPIADVIPFVVRLD
jgi:TonB family protein